MATPLKDTSVSNSRKDATAQGGKDASALIDAIDKQEQEQAIEKVAGAGAMAASQDEPGGPLQFAIPDEMRAQMSRELQEALHQIETGFGDLTKPTDICDQGREFFVIDGFTIPDYEDKKTGDVSAKHIFRLQMVDSGLVVSMMQSDARPRRVIARACMLAAGLGGRLKLGPYRLEKKTIVGQIQPALIFVPQAGFKQEAY